MVRVLNWNGRDLPAELRDLPAGRYVVEPIDEELDALSAEEEAGLRQAIASIEAGHGVPIEKLDAAIDEALARRRHR